MSKFEEKESLKNELEEMGLDDDEMEIITIIDDETAEELEFAVLGSVVENNETYHLVIELVDLDGEDEEEEEDCLYILKESYDENKELCYEPISDDAEFDKIANLFKESGVASDFEIE
ncbi:hypothetical protein AGMMS49975_15200 [Clostridia bacterium]|nr:hypothetical protein AGMMS49975_15200 [Clostridia bacterium]GHU73819.1 hypothetical protein FACS1894188_00330 [Clostridia bacterium]